MNERERQDRSRDNYDPNAPSGPQNWEDFADQVDDRYARNGGLDELVAVLGGEYDRDAAEAARQCGRLNDLCAGALRDAYFDARAAGASFDEGLLAALGIACWNHARRLGGEPDMVGEVRKARDGSRPPFGSIASAWGFALETSYLTLGAGPLGSVIAETSELARAVGRAAERVGRARGVAWDGADVGGFLPIEWMASSPTHVGGSGAKNEGAITLREDVVASIARAVPAQDRLGLELVVLGEEQRVPRAREQGNRFRSRAQFERVRLTMRDAARVVWAVEQEAWKRGHDGAVEPQSEEAIRKRIERAKDALQLELERRELIPAPPPRPVRSSPERPASHLRTSLFAEGWS